MTQPDRLYQIACMFPALKRKGVEQGHVPGITQKTFNEGELSDYLYKGSGGMLSHGEFILLEFLLNLSNPTGYPKFNIGNALHVLDPSHMKALLEAIIKAYSRS
jgi:hypothetical protein